MPDYPDLPPVSEDPNQPLPDVAPDSELVPYRIGRKEPGGEYQYTTGYAPRGRPAIAPPQGMGFSGAGVPDLSPLISEAFQRLPVDEALKAVEAASRYIGQRGYMKDLESGQNAAQAFAKWGPMLFRQATGLPEAINRTVPTPLSQMQRYQIARNRPLDEALIAERQARATAAGQITPYQQAQLDLRKAAAEEAKKKRPVTEEEKDAYKQLDEARRDMAKLTATPVPRSQAKQHQQAMDDATMRMRDARVTIAKFANPAAPPPIDAAQPLAQPQETAPAPFKEGATVRNKKDGKLYRIVNGQPILVKE